MQLTWPDGPGITACFAGEWPLRDGLRVFRVPMELGKQRRSSWCTECACSVYLLRQARTGATPVQAAYRGTRPVDVHRSLTVIGRSPTVLQSVSPETDSSGGQGLGRGQTLRMSKRSSQQWPQQCGHCCSQGAEGRVRPSFQQSAAIPWLPPVPFLGPEMAPVGVYSILYPCPAGGNRPRGSHTH